MKKKNLLLTAVATIGLAAATLAQTVPNYVPTNGLVGWWPFNGNANDESGNGNNGTVSGATLTTDRFGNANKAYNFNGQNNNIVIPNSLSLNPGLISISIWVNPTVFGPSEQYIIDKSIDLNPGSVNRSWAIRIGGGGQLDLEIRVNNIYYSFSTTSTLNLNQWNNLVFVYDGITAKLYKDNLIVINQSLPGTLSNFNYDLSIGYFPNANIPPYGYFWNGKLDDIGIWNRALTNQEISALYQSQNCNLTTNITPITALINAGANAQFTASSSDPNSTYQWQTNPAQNGWQTVISNASYSGVTTNSLIVSNVQLANHNQPFRVIATAGNCVDTSATVFIQIVDTCVNTVIDTNYVNQTIYDTTYVTVTDTNYVNQTIYDTTYVTVTDTNHVTVYDTLTTYISVTDTLFIDINTVGLNNNPVINTIKVFPNPSNSILNLNYGNYATLNNYRVKITNALSQTIYDQAITQQSETLDLSTFGGNGIYYLSILNPQGNVVEVRKIVLQ